MNSFRSFDIIAFERTMQMNCIIHQNIERLNQNSNERRTPELLLHLFVENILQTLRQFLTGRSSDEKRNSNNETKRELFVPDVITI